MTAAKDLRMERELLWALISDPDAYDECVAFLKPGEALFTDMRHSAIYRSIQELKTAGTAVDPVVLLSHMQRSGTVDAVGTGYYYELIGDYISSAHAALYAERLYEGYVRRALVKVADYIARQAGGATPVKSIAETVITQMHGVLSGVSKAEVHSLSDVTRTVIREYQERIASKASAGILTGIGPLDYLTGGWQGTDLIVVGARPGIGKTNIARHFVMAAAQQHPSLFISAEMKKERIAQRILASESGISDTGFRTCTLTDAQVSSVISAANRIDDREGRRLYLCDTPRITIAEVEVLIRRMVREKGIRLVAIDYLQLIGAEDKKTREREVADISSRLKAIAMESGIPVIVLAQINRDGEALGDRPPKQSNLRDSGQIEQDADAILLLHRFNGGKQGVIPDGYGEFSGMPSDGMLYVDLAKHRGGPEGWFFVNYHRATGRISAIDTQHGDVRDGGSHIDGGNTPF